VRPSEYEIRQGDALDVLRRLPDGIAQTCITSPPYYGLRDYGHDEQLGQERTVGEYVERLVEVLEQVGRVLRPDGTLWLNLGDSYATNITAGKPAQTGLSAAADRHAPHRRRARNRSAKIADYPGKRVPPGFKPKDLLGVPWRVAFALQDAGWWLRAAIIWDKPNPMPESVEDRPTSSSEMLFLLARSEVYFYDVDGYREPFADERQGRDRGTAGRERNRGGRTDDFTNPSGIDPSRHGGRQLRNVWRIPTVPFPGAHFAVFPPELPRRCVLLGSSPRACERCGAPWRRIVRRRRLLDGEPVTGSWEARDGGARMGGEGVGHWRFTSETHELGWRPTCTCGAPPGVKPGDLDEIDSPTGDGEALDPTLDVGRKGLARPRTGDGGTRIMTRWEQRPHARQLGGSPHRAEMEAEAGPDTFAHYLRTDPAGARPPRHGLLEVWRERGWVEPVEPPPSWWDEDDAGRCLVLDPFAGAGTTGLVAVDEGRDFMGVEINSEYAQMARERIGERAAAPRFEFLT
jgi:DNA modification methylase